MCAAAREWSSHLHPGSAHRRSQLLRRRFTWRSDNRLENWGRKKKGWKTGLGEMTATPAEINTSADLVLGNGDILLVWAVFGGLSFSSVHCFGELVCTRFSIMLFSNISSTISMWQHVSHQPPTEAWCPKGSNQAPCDSRCLDFLPPPTKLSRNPFTGTHHCKVAGDRPGDSWRHSSGQIMSSHRPGMGHQMCVHVD